MLRTFPIASVLSRSLQPWPSKKPKNGCVILVVRPRAILHRLRSDGLRVVIIDWLSLIRHAVKTTALQQLEERSLACNSSGWPNPLFGWIVSVYPVEIALSSSAYHPQNA